MKKFIFGLVVFILGFIFSMLCLFYTIMNPVILNGKSGLFVSFKENFTLIPFAISLLIIIIGALICYDTFDTDNAKNNQLIEDTENADKGKESSL